MLVNIKVTGGLNIESGHIDPKATQGLIGENEQIENIPFGLWEPKMGLIDTDVSKNYDL